MTSPERLKPRRHASPPGWPAETFERLTDALAAALLAAMRRRAVENLPRGQNEAGA